MHKNGPTTYNEHLTAYNIMTLVCPGWLHEVQWVFWTAFWSMDVTGVYACLFQADITTVLSHLKGEVRTINDRNICERRSCMKNNGKSHTFKFVSGEERRPSEVQRVSWAWRLPGATHSSADLTSIRKWLEIQAPELSELESVQIELGSCCSDLDKQVSEEICRIWRRQFEIPFRR